MASSEKSTARHILLCNVKTDIISRDEWYRVQEYKTHLENGEIHTIECLKHVLSLSSSDTYWSHMQHWFLCSHRPKTPTGDIFRASPNDDCRKQIIQTYLNGSFSAATICAFLLSCTLETTRWELLNTMLPKCSTQWNANAIEDLNRLFESECYRVPAVKLIREHNKKRALHITPSVSSSATSSASSSSSSSSSASSVSVITISDTMERIPTIVAAPVPPTKMQPPGALTSSTSSSSSSPSSSSLSTSMSFASSGSANAAEVVYTMPDGKKKPVITNVIKEKECVVCHHYSPNLVFAPCGHQCCCQLCISPYMFCPMCRVPIESFIRLAHLTAL